MSDVHAGDSALNSVLRRFPALYRRSHKRTEELLAAFLKPHLKDLQPRKNEKKKDYALRFMRVFSGVRWTLTRRRIATLFTDAGIDAADDTNDVLETAFADGMNLAAYAMSLSGVEMWPVTVSVVAGLAAAKIITLNKRKLKKGKDIAYNEQRIQSAIHSAVMQGIMPDKFPAFAADSIARSRQNEQIAAARAHIYSASDSGAYLAGLEAEKAGIDVEKTWYSMNDMRVRPSHMHLHGVTVPIDGVFHGYYGDLRYPHDPEAPYVEIYHCRCRMAVHVKGRAPSERDPGFKPVVNDAYRKWRDTQIKKAGTELELLKLHKRLGR